MRLAEHWRERRSEKTETARFEAPAFTLERGGVVQRRRRQIALAAAQAPRRAELLIGFSDDDSRLMDGSAFVLLLTESSGRRGVWVRETGFSPLLYGIYIYIGGGLLARDGLKMTGPLRSDTLEQQRGTSCLQVSTQIVFLSAEFHEPSLRTVT